MKIKKIKKLSANKYKIEFTNGDSLITYDQVILKNNILLKSEIDNDLYLEMVKANDYYSMYSKAVKYIMTRLRSEEEIKKYLSKYVDDTNMVHTLIEQLKQEGLINDHRYIQAFIEDKVNLTNYGPKKIIKELDNLGMNKDAVLDTLANYDEELFFLKAEKYAQKKVRMNHKNSIYIVKQKIERDLLDLGYHREMITEILSNISIDDGAAIEKEADKLYRKLQSKYSGNELLYQVKQRLYKKGFTNDTIQMALEKYSF